jgi:hypothetical protein
MVLILLIFALLILVGGFAAHWVWFLLILVLLVALLGR